MDLETVCYKVPNETSLSINKLDNQYVVVEAGKKKIKLLNLDDL